MSFRYALRELVKRTACTSERLCLPKTYFVVRNLSVAVTDPRLADQHVRPRTRQLSNSCAPTLTVDDEQSDRAAIPGDDPAAPAATPSLSTSSVRSAPESAEHGESSSASSSSSAPGSSDAGVVATQQQRPRRNRRPPETEPKAESELRVYEKMSRWFNTKEYPRVIQVFRDWKSGKFRDHLGEFRPCGNTYNLYLMACSNIAISQCNEVNWTMSNEVDWTTFTDTLGEMDNRSISPSIHAYNACLFYCSMKGLGIEAGMMLCSMRQAGVYPNFKSYRNAVHAHATDQRERYRFSKALQAGKLIIQAREDGLLNQLEDDKAKLERMYFLALDGLLRSRRKCCDDLCLQLVQAMVEDGQHLAPISKAAEVYGELMYLAVECDNLDLTRNLVHLISAYRRDGVSQLRLADGEVLAMLNLAARHLDLDLAEAAWAFLDWPLGTPPHPHGPPEDRTQGEEHPGGGAEEGHSRGNEQGSGDQGEGSGEAAEDSKGWRPDSTGRQSGNPPDAALFHALVHIYGETGNFQMAFKVLWHLVEQHPESDAAPVLFNRLVQRLATHWRETKRGSEELLSLHTSEDPEQACVPAVNCIVAAHIRCCRLEQAFQEFIEMKERFGLEADIHTYTLLLEGCVATASFDYLEAILEEMQNLGLRWNSQTYDAVLLHLITSKDLPKAVLVLSEARDAGCAPSKAVCLRLLRSVRSLNVNPSTQAMNLDATEHLAHLGYLTTQSDNQMGPMGPDDSRKKAARRPGGLRGAHTQKGSRSR